MKMKTNKTYEVALLNEQCKFDEAKFGCIEDAAKWVIGRGGRYTALFASSTDPMGLRVAVIDNDAPVFLYDDRYASASAGDQIRKRANREQIIAYLRKSL